MPMRKSSLRFKILFKDNSKYVIVSLLNIILKNQISIFNIFYIIVKGLLFILIKKNKKKYFQNL